MYFVNDTVQPMLFILSVKTTSDSGGCRHGGRCWGRVETSSCNFRRWAWKLNFYVSLRARILAVRCSFFLCVLFRLSLHYYHQFNLDSRNAGTYEVTSGYWVKPPVSLFSRAPLVDTLPRQRTPNF